MDDFISSNQCLCSEPVEVSTCAETFSTSGFQAFQCIDSFSPKKSKVNKLKFKFQFDKSKHCNTRHAVLSERMECVSPTVVSA